MNFRKPLSVLSILVVPGLLAAACNSGRTGASAPAWAASLGAGVSITAPGSKPAPGTSSPGSVVKAEFAAFSSGRLSGMCAYVEPVVQTKCQTAVAGQTSSGTTYTNFSFGYIAVKGAQALVGTLGTDCEQDTTPPCVTNSDPAAIFSSAKPFDTLYADAVASAASSAHAYSLIPCVRVGSKWFVYIPENSF